MIGRIKLAKKIIVSLGALILFALVFNSCASGPATVAIAIPPGCKVEQVAVPVHPSATNPGVKKGVAAVRKRDFAAALKEYRPLAEQGNAQAQYELGRLYRFGWGVPKDPKEAVNWLRLAAEQGVAWAQYMLGDMSEDSEAIKWYTLGAEQGVTWSQISLGYRYRDGRGVPEDNVEAAKWFVLASKNGNSQAQKIMGELYEQGEGVAQDNVYAYVFYSLASRTQQFKKIAAEAIKNIERLAQGMSNIEIEQAKVVTKQCLNT